MSNDLTVRVNDNHRCPITQDIMVDPVAADPCGHIFERAAIEQWMERNPKCPFDGKAIVQLNSEEALRAETHAFIREHPDLFDNKSPEQMEAEVNQAYANAQMSIDDLRIDANRQMARGNLDLYRYRLVQILKRARNVQHRAVLLPNPHAPGELFIDQESTGEIDYNGRHCLVKIRMLSLYLHMEPIEIEPAEDHRPVPLCNQTLLACAVAAIAIDVILFAAAVS